MARDKAETILGDIFALAGITVDGDQPYDIQVHNKKFYRRVLGQKSLGCGYWKNAKNLDEAQEAKSNHLNLLEHNNLQPRGYNYYNVPKQEFGNENKSPIFQAADNIN
jgi:hypothetical protein